MAFGKGPANPRWRGGVWISSKGYRWVFVGVDHPCNRSGSKGYAPEHLLVFWQTHERLPRKGFHIHHDDENKLNNAPGNLFERRTDLHGRLHMTQKRARELGRLGGKASAERKRLTNAEAFG